MIAFACYTIATTFGPQLSGTLSGYISDRAPWPVKFWWTIAAIGTVILLFFFFIEDTTYDRNNSERLARNPHRSFVQDRIATLLPSTAVVQVDSSKYGILDPVVIGLQPVSVCDLLMSTEV